MSAGDCFITIDQIPGESEDLAFPDAIQVTGWSWGVSANLAVSSGFASGQVTSRADVRMFDFSHAVDSASAGLLQRCVNNASIPKAVMVMRRAGGPSSQKYLVVTFRNVRIAAVDLVHNAGYLIPVEQVRLAFEEVSFEYVPQAKNGSEKTGRKTFGWRVNPT